jgi:hypothetical protein
MESQGPGGIRTSFGPRGCYAPRPRARRGRRTSLPESIVQGTVCKTLARQEVKPHKVRYYLEPRAVFRREHETQTAFWLGVKPRLGFLGDMSGVVVEDQLDGSVCRISCVEPLEEADELTRTMAILACSATSVSHQRSNSKQASSPISKISTVTLSSIPGPRKSARQLVGVDPRRRRTSRASDATRVGVGPTAIL